MRSITGRARLAVLIVTATLALAGCAPQQRLPEPAPPPAAPPPPPEPTTPHEPHPIELMNSNLSPEEAAWHLRAGLNVAALVCDQDRKLGLAAGYNHMLKHQRKPLAAAYRAEGARYNGNAALDAHVTRLYNIFAQPPSKANFCGTAARLVTESQAIEPEHFIAYAPGALDRLVEPPGARLASASSTIVPSSGTGGWLIQLGAYSDARTARTAWERIQLRSSAFTGFAPRYEQATGSPLVRLRIGPVNDQRQADALCAAASNVGVDCLPIPLTA